MNLCKNFKTNARINHVDVVVILLIVILSLKKMNRVIRKGNYSDIMQLDKTGEM